MSGEQGPHSHAAPAWFRFLDIAVWIAVVVLAGIAAEWFLGRVMRETLARQASRHLAAVAADTQSE